MQVGVQPWAIPMACDPDCMERIEPFAHCGAVALLTVWLGTTQNGCRSQQTSMMRASNSDCCAFTEAMTACVWGMKNKRCRKLSATWVEAPTCRLFITNSSMATCCSSKGSRMRSKICCDFRGENRKISFESFEIHP